MEKDENSIVSQHFNAMDQLTLVEQDLKYITDSLFVVGLGGVAETLLIHAKTIKDSREAAKSAFGQSINDRFKAAQESSANLIKAVLHVGD